MVPARPLFGTNVTDAVTVNVAVARSGGTTSVGSICIVLGPRLALAPTVKEAVTVPSAPIWHVDAGVVATRLTVDPVKAHRPASPTAKPDPVMVTDAPRGPEVGVGVITCGTKFSVAVVETTPSETVIVSVRGVNVTRTTNSATVGANV
jgi:hypothetical protein